jgi:hypothetical protein
MFKRHLLVVLTGLVSAVFVSGLVWGQEYRATITGIVTDSSKAIIPNATVSVRNLDTNEVLKVKTNAAGVYTVPFLHPGHRLEVSAEAPGFKKATFPPIVLSVSQTQTADFVLQVGAINEVITVTSEAYAVGLDSSKADRGIVVDNATISALPLDGRNPLSIMDVMAGVTNENGPGSQGVPTDMFQASWYTINGGLAQNTEYTIDGMPDNSIPWYSSGPSAIPSVDAIQEFKVITNPYDAQYGRTAGGVVDMELKSGTNALHGTVYEFARRTFMDANTWANDNTVPVTPRPDHTEDQYGFEIGGPVYIPHIYNGRNKTFFMFNLERYKETIPQLYYFDIPDAQWLQGNFTNFVETGPGVCVNPNITSCEIPLYDPATGTAAGTARQLIRNSQGQYNMVDPSRFNPIAVNVLNLILASTHPTTVALPNLQPWESVWMDDIPATPHFDNYIAKVDEIIGTKDHLSVNYIHDYNATNSLQTPPAVWQNGSTFTEYHLNAGVDWVHTFRSNLLFDFHVSYQRYWRMDGEPIGWNYNPAQLGFPAALINELPLKTGFPQISFTMTEPAAAQGNGYGNWIDPSRDLYYMPDDTDSVAPTLTWIRNKHTLRTGLDFRITHAVQNVNWTNSIQLSANGQATSEYWYWNGFNDQPTLPNGTPLAVYSGNSILDFLLSQPNSVSVQNQANPIYTWHYWAPWVQDDWKITPKLTLNLGLRYDLNGPPTARHNWLNTGFNFTAVNPINGAVQAVDPRFPTVKGGVTFPTPGNNLPWARDYSKIQPRVGFAYQLHANTVIRGGFGRLVMSPMGDEPTTTGFSNWPNFVNSPDGGPILYPDNLTNPFPNGIPAIPGSSLGLKTSLGNGIYYLNPNYKLPYVDQGSFGVEQAMPKNGKLELSYVASRSYDQDALISAFMSNGALDENIPLYKSCNELLSTSSNPNPQANCMNQINNPFYNLPGVVGGLGQDQTLPAYQLARPYPEFAGITEGQVNWGKIWYNSLQTTYAQRVSWVQVNASWTWSKTMQSGGWLDPFYQLPMRSIAPTDRPHRVTLTSVLDMPVGRGRKYFSGMNRPLDAVLGGWQLATSFFWEGGQPLAMPSGYNLVGNIHGPKQNAPGTIDLGMNGCFQIWDPPVGNTPGYYSAPTGSDCSEGVAWQAIAPYAPTKTQPFTDAIREPGTQQIDTDLNKSFKFTERVSMQLRLEMFNVMNHPTFYGNYEANTSLGTPDFGAVIKAYGQANNPRRGQLGAKIIW